MTDRNKAVELYGELVEVLGLEVILDYLVYNYLSGAEALDALRSVEREFIDED